MQRGRTEGKRWKGKRGKIKNDMGRKGEGKDKKVRRRMRKRIKMEKGARKGR